MNKIGNKKVIAGVFGAMLIVAMAFVMPMATKAVGPNLIQNPSMETGTTAPANWHKGGFGTNTRVLTWVTLPDTTKALKTEITSYTDGDAKWYPDNITVEPGALYRYTDTYSSNVTSYLTVAYTHAIGPNTNETIATIPSSGGVLTTGSQDFSVPSDVSSITVYHLISSVGEITIDDVSLKLVQPASENLFTKGIVSITFDDGWQSQYDNALPILNANNMNATFYLMSLPLQQNLASGYMDANTALSIRTPSHQHEIGAHTVHHCNLVQLPNTAGCAFVPTTSPTTASYEVNEVKNDLLGMNFVPVDTFAYPNGAYNDSIKSLLSSAGFSAARSIDEGYNTRYSDKLALKTVVINSSIQLSRVEEMIDAAAANKTWLILTFHQVTSNAIVGTDGAVDPTYFQAVVNKLAAKQVAATNSIEVKTVHDVLPLMATSVVTPTDTTAPILTLSGSATMNLTVGATFTDPGAMANDNVDGNITGNIIVTGGPVNTAVPGTTVLHYNVSDAAGNAAIEATRTVTVVSAVNTAPVITLTGSASVSLASGDAYSDAGATALDTEDGDITSQIVRTGSVVTSTPGTYTLTYNVTDLGGLAATSVTRTVIVAPLSGGSGGNNGSGNGGGSSGGSTGGSTGGSAPIVTQPTTPPTGSVLGSTCTILITKDMARGKKNSVEEVKKLQKFLNDRGAKLPVTGFYGTMTKSAVKNFQKQYKDEILKPLKLTLPTGNVYGMTRTKINALVCVAN